MSKRMDSRVTEVKPGFKPSGLKQNDLDSASTEGGRIGSCPQPWGFQSMPVPTQATRASGGNPRLQLTQGICPKSVGRSSNVKGHRKTRTRLQRGSLWISFRWGCRSSHFWLVPHIGGFRSELKQEAPPATTFKRLKKRRAALILGMETHDHSRPCGYLEDSHMRPR